jgi:DNA-directed RNA polymerase subunit RPC12/RpoP
MPSYICVTCGNQYAESNEPPGACPVCLDERQYVNPRGQMWATMEQLVREHRNELRPLEPGLTGIVTVPKFAIGQRALLVQAAGGNVLWDCLSLIDETTVEAVQALGGISSLAMSHPHMFGSMVEWSHAFGKAPIFLHADYRDWVQRPDPVIEFWEGDTKQLNEGVTLYRCGGHFTGSTVLLWPDGAEGRGVLLSTDTIHVVPDRRHVSFMYSYPNLIPLPPTAVEGIVETVMPLKFDRIYGHFSDLEIRTGAKDAIRRSAERYTRAAGW